MRITIRPAAAPNTEIDVTRALIAAVAHELHRHASGNDVLNWLEAERFIATLASAEPAPRPAPPAAPGRGQGTRARRKTAAIANPDRYSGPIPILTVGDTARAI